MKIIFKELNENIETGEKYKELFTMTMKTPIVRTPHHFELLFAEPTSGGFVNEISDNIDSLNIMMRTLRLYGEIDGVKIPDELHNIICSENLNLLISVIPEKEDLYVERHDYDLYYDNGDGDIHVNSNVFESDILISEGSSCDYPSLSEFIGALQTIQDELKSKYEGKEIYVKLRDPMIYYPDGDIVSDLINGISIEEDEDGDIAVELGYDESAAEMDCEM